jgi:hypothetical protein
MNYRESRTFALWRERFRRDSNKGLQLLIADLGLSLVPHWDPGL